MWSAPHEVRRPKRNRPATALAIALRVSAFRPDRSAKAADVRRRTTRFRVDWGPVRGRPSAPFRAPEVAERLAVAGRLHRRCVSIFVADDCHTCTADLAALGRILLTCSTRIHVAVGTDTDRKRRDALRRGSTVRQPKTNKSDRNVSRIPSSPNLAVSRHRPINTLNPLEDLYCC